jgi:hypothetical protein
LSALPEPDRAAFACLHAAVAADWGPRDTYERRWVVELVACMLRQDRLRTLELATLAAAGQESPPSDAMVRKLDTFARYGARIDMDMAKALQALRNLRGRPDAWIEDVRNDTSEPAAMAAPPRTCEPEPMPAAIVARTPEPERALNRQQRRALAATRRKRAA